MSPRFICKTLFSNNVYLWFIVSPFPRRSPTSVRCVRSHSRPPGISGPTCTFMMVPGRSDVMCVTGASANKQTSRIIFCFTPVSVFWQVQKIACYSHVFLAYPTGIYVNQTRLSCMTSILMFWHVDGISAKRFDVNILDRIRSDHFLIEKYSYFSVKLIK